MYVKGPQESRINAVLCVSGQFKLVGDTLPAPISAQLEMTYLNADEGTMFGGYQITAQNLSEATMEALRRFIELAEEDFGSAVFGSGVQVSDTESEQTQPNTGMAAESNRGV